MKKIEERLLKKPKYKVGDIVVYLDRYTNDGMTIVLQSKITAANALIELSNPNDVLSWFYSTKEIEENSSDSLVDSDIMYKL